MPITLRDVAAKAGVSPVVVSRVLHNKATSIRVSEATAERVRQAAWDLGYRVNVFAQNFRAQQTMTIGVLHGIGFSRPRFDQGPRYFAALMDGVIEGAFRYGYSVTLCPKLLGATPGDAVSDGRFDGLVWYSSVDSDASRLALSRCSVPLVLLHAYASEFNNQHPAVICDNEQGIGLALDHLFSLGHRRIAYAMQTEPTVVESLSRKDSFLQHMKRKGLDLNSENVLHIPSRSAKVDDYLQEKPKHTAVIAHNDELAAEFLKKAPKYGVRVPDDLAVVGFDSTNYCDELRPSLTSISQPLSLMGEKAIELLVQRMNGEANQSLQIVFPCGLDVRGSTLSEIHSR